MENETVQPGVVKSFSLEALVKPEYFVSLLFYFGLLSFSHKGARQLSVPNRTVKSLMYGYRNQIHKKGDFTEAVSREKIAEAFQQHEKYSKDANFIQRSKGRSLKSLALVFSGWELKAAGDLE